MDNTAFGHWLSKWKWLHSYCRLCAQYNAFRSSWCQLLPLLNLLSNNRCTSPKF